FWNRCSLCGLTSEPHVGRQVTRGGRVCRARPILLKQSIKSFLSRHSKLDSGAIVPDSPSHHRSRLCQGVRKANSAFAYARPDWRRDRNASRQNPSDVLRDARDEFEIPIAKADAVLAKR